MSGYLVDTNVVSAFAPGKPPVRPETVAWFEMQTDRLFLSAICVIEIEAGIAKLRRAGATRRAADLATWFDRLLGLYGGKVLAVDVAVARLAGTAAERAKASGHAPGLADIVIAATAGIHRLVVLTRNRRHFDPLGVAVLDPFEDTLPPEPSSIMP
ncbi:MAG: type II toxin-antitoxin system VapC family toxin [Acetobacteraceae bacterium]